MTLPFTNEEVVFVVRKFEVKEKARKFLRLEEGQEKAVMYKAFVDTQFSRALWGKDLETGEDVLVPLVSSLRDLEKEMLNPGDVVAIANRGMKKSKTGRMYKNVVYTVYRKNVDFDESELEQPPF
jgi:hypothetical protein